MPHVSPSCRPVPGPAAPRARRLASAALLLAAMVGVAATTFADGVRQRTTAEMLVDAARDFALRVRNRRAPSDITEVRTLLEAATRLDPNLPEPRAWLYELALLTGDEALARESLRQLVTLDPTHDGAFAAWVTLGPQEFETVEQRRDWLKSLLNGGLNDVRAAQVHVALAQVALLQFDRAAAKGELDDAARLDPLNPDVPLVRLALVAPDDAPAARLRAALAALRVAPQRSELLFEIGQLLDACGAFDDAAMFYEQGLWLSAATGLTPTGEALVAVARNAAARGDNDAALLYAEQAATIYPTIPMQFNEIWLKQQLGREVDAEVLRRNLVTRFNQIDDPNAAPIEELAQAAWFYTWDGSERDRALKLARAAAGRAPEDIFVQRVLGWALAAANQTAEAMNVLDKIADRDAFAAIRLAQLQLAEDDPDAAKQTLMRIEYPPRTGPAAALLAVLVAEKLPELKTYWQCGGVEAALSEFDPAVLAWPRMPEKFLEADAAPETLSFTPGEPWRVLVTLRNKSTLPLAVGPGRALNAFLLVSYSLRGDQERTYENLLSINVDRVRVIPAGGVLRLKYTVDVGPAARISAGTPQQVQRVTLRILLDPQRGPDGEWRPAPGGLTLEPVRFNRVAIRASREALHALFSALRGEKRSLRWQAISVLASLLGEAQRAAADQLHYRPEAVPTAQLSAALAAALQSDDWETRARTLHALQVAGLDARLMSATQDCLKADHWLVRLLALRLMARQGETALPVARAATNDDDRLVRQLAEAYLARWSKAAPASQPSRPTSQPAQSTD